MKKTLLYIILLFVFALNANSQTYSNIIKDKEIENLLLWDIDNTVKYSEDQKLWKKKIKETIIPWNEALIQHMSGNPPYDFGYQMTELIKKFKKTNELFSELDFEYMKMQFDNELTKDWKLKCKKGKLIENPKNNYYSYSIPLFDKTHSKAIIYKEFFCGSVCAYGTVEIYVKSENEWKLFESVFLWMS